MADGGPEPPVRDGPEGRGPPRRLLHTRVPPPGHVLTPSDGLGVGSVAGPGRPSGPPRVGGQWNGVAVGPTRLAAGRPAVPPTDTSHVVVTTRGPVSQGQGRPRP